MNNLFYILIAILFCACMEDVDKVNDDIIISMPQSHIEWPSLADSPWPMYRHDPQSTNRSQFQGPQTGIPEWILEIPLMYGPEKQFQVLL